MSCVKLWGQRHAATRPVTRLRAEKCFCAKWRGDGVPALGANRAGSGLPAFCTIRTEAGTPAVESQRSGHPPRHTQMHSPRRICGSLWRHHATNPTVGCPLDSDVFACCLLPNSQHCDVYGRSNEAQEADRCHARAQSLEGEFHDATCLYAATSTPSREIRFRSSCSRPSSLNVLLAFKFST